MSYVFLFKDNGTGECKRIFFMLIYKNQLGTIRDKNRWNIDKNQLGTIRDKNRWNIDCVKV